MKKIPHSLLIGLSVLVMSATANAQIAEGSVTGSDFTTPTWVNGSSDSVGSWFMNLGENATTNISDSNLSGRTSIGSEAFFVNGGIDAGGNSTYADVYRPLGGSLAATQSITLSASYLWDGGSRGIEFVEAGGGAGALFRVEHVNVVENNTLQLAGDGLGAETLISSDAFEKAYTFTVSYVDASTVSFLATEYGSTTPLLSTNVTVAAMPNEIKFYVGGTTDSANLSNYGLYFNDLTTVPEPSTYALFGLGAVVFGVHLLRRRLRTT
jgi:hypothetical protein